MTCCNEAVSDAITDLGRRFVGHWGFRGQPNAKLLLISFDLRGSVTSVAVVQNETFPETASALETKDTILIDSGKLSGVSFGATGSQFIHIAGLTFGCSRRYTEFSLSEILNFDEARLLKSLNLKSTNPACRGEDRPNPASFTGLLGAVEYSASSSSSESIGSRLLEGKEGSAVNESKVAALSCF